MAEQNDTNIFKALVSEKHRAVTLQLTSLEAVNRLINHGLFLDARVFTYER